MLRRMSAKRLRQWEIYEQLEPFGELRADYRAASIAAMIFNMAVAKKDRKPLTDFLLKWEGQDERKKQSPEEQLALLKVMAAAYSTATPTVAEQRLHAQQDKEMSDKMREQVMKARAAMKDV